MTAALLVTLLLTRPFVDDAGRTVDIPSVPKRVFAAGPPASVWVYAIAPDTMLAWTRSLRDDEKALIPEPYRSLPVTGSHTGHKGTASPETVAALKPDLIVDVGTDDSGHASLADRTQKQLGVPYVLIGGNLETSAKTLRRLGELFAKPADAEALATYIEGLLAAAKTAVSADSKRPKVYLSRGPTGLETALTGSLFSEVIDAAGATNIAERGNTDAIVTVSFETIAKAAPAYIITQDPRFAEQAGTDANWKSLHAKVLLAPHLPFGWIDAPPALNRVLGLMWLTGKLHALKWNERDTVRTFYDRVYHVHLSDQQLDELVKP